MHCWPGSSRISLAPSSPAPRYKLPPPPPVVLLALNVAGGAVAAARNSFWLRKQREDQRHRNGDSPGESPQAMLPGLGRETRDFGAIWGLGGRRLKNHLGAGIPPKKSRRSNEMCGHPAPADLLELRAFSKTCQSTIETLAGMALHLHTQPCSQIPHPSPDSSLTFLS